MADFVQTMRDWFRMCRYHCDQCDDDDTDDPCESCGLEELDICDSVYDMVDRESGPDFGRAEQIIAKWAQKHPEPHYPTWAEWFASMEGNVEDLLYKEIPANVAEMLGAKPKLSTRDGLKADVERMMKKCAAKAP